MGEENQFEGGKGIFRSLAKELEQLEKALRTLIGETNTE